MRIKDILGNKEITSIYAVSPEATVFDAISQMADRNVGAMLVTREGKLVGILTERDYLREVALQGRDSRQTSVSSIMSRKVIYVDSETSVDQAMNIMTDKRIRHLPVLDDERLSGVVSIGDLVKAKTEKQETHIRTLEAYIAGQYPG